MKLKLCKILIVNFFILTLLNNLVLSQDTNKIIELGQILVQKQKNFPFEISYSLEDKKVNTFDLSQNLTTISGLHPVISGGRNEMMLAVRGFDLRQTPVYIDGVPVYVPYDGYVDLARFLTTNVASIDISKSFASLIYGPNSMGGAINIVSQKPVKRFEYDIAGSLYDDYGKDGAVYLGTNLEKFFITAHYAIVDFKNYRMSADFDSTKYENGGYRENSYRKDQKIDLKMGFNPNSRHQYIVGYTNNKGEKGNPVYCGTDEKNPFYTKPRYWQWPHWDKQTIYFLSKTNINDHNTIKSRIYYDKYYSLVKAYDDNTYSTQNKPSSFDSHYNDYATGGNLEYENSVFKNVLFKSMLQYRQDYHQESDKENIKGQFKDNFFTLAIENEWKVKSNLMIVGGIGASYRQNVLAKELKNNEMVDYEKADIDRALNYQIAGLYSLGNHNFTLAYSHRTRFATLKDRYSYRLGKSVPNPFLIPEKADNFDFSYTFKFRSLTLMSSVFYNHLNDVIMIVDNAVDNKSQTQNVGKAEFRGFEAQLQYKLSKYIDYGANYTYIERKNLTNPSLFFTDVPYHRITSTIVLKPLNFMSIYADFIYNGKTYSTSYGTPNNAFWILNSGINFNFLKLIYIEAGVDNVFDKNYSYTEGYPAAGRSFFVGLRVKNI